MSKEIIFPQEFQPMAVESTFSEVTVIAESVDQPVQPNELGPVGGTIAIGVGVLVLAAVIRMNEKGNFFPWSKPLDDKRSISPDSTEITPSYLKDLQPQDHEN